MKDKNPHTVDPIKEAFLMLRLPGEITLRCGTVDVEKMLKWYLLRIGEDKFRKAIYGQWLENEVAGIPKKPVLAFLCRLFEAYCGGAR